MYFVLKYLAPGGSEWSPEERFLWNFENRTPIGSLTVRAEPDFIAVPVDSIGRAIIYARVLDVHNNAVPNQEVEFQTNLGWLARPTLTDSSGTATTEYYIQPVVDFPPDSTEMTATVLATIPGTAFQATATVRVRKGG